MSEPGVGRLDIVIIDCNGVATSEARQLLAQNGLTHALASDSEAGAVLIQNHEPAVVLFFPEKLDGEALTLASELSAAHRFKHFEFLAAVARSCCDPGQVVEVGITLVLSLPLDWQELVALLRLKVEANRSIRATEELCRRRGQTLEQAEIAGFSIDIVFRSVSWPVEVVTLLGLSEQMESSIASRTDVGSWQDLLERVAVEDRQAVHAAVSAALDTRTGCSISFHDDGAGEHRRRLHLQARPGFGRDGEIDRLDCILRREMAAAADQPGVDDEASGGGLSTRDPIRVRGLLEDAMADSDEGAMIVVHLDQFRRIYHRYGYETGARLLRRFGDRLVHAIQSDAAVLPRNQDRSRSDKIVAQLADSDYAVILKGDSDRDHVRRVLNRLRAHLKSDLEIDGRPIALTLVFGVATWPEDGSEADEILRSASAATSSTVMDTSSTFHALKAARYFNREAALHDAIRNGELFIEYQPKHSVRSRQIVGFEVLVRWRHQGELVEPDVFVPMAERTGFIHEMGRWVVDQALDQYARWERDRIGSYPLALNVSPYQLADDNFLSHLLGACAARNLPPRCLQVEITESALVRNEVAVIDQLEKLRAEGVAIALDDFGTGYSSLSYLCKLPLDVLKIDRSFVAACETNALGPGVLVSIISIGVTLGLRVVVEGVETEGQANMLSEWGCHELQGFLFSKPVSAEVATHLLEISDHLDRRAQN